MRNSKRTWKSKLKEWAFNKNLTSKDLCVLGAKARKRKAEDGKETSFHRWGSEISLEKIERLRKNRKTLQIASPSARKN